MAEITTLRRNTRRLETLTMQRRLAREWARHPWLRYTLIISMRPNRLQACRKRLGALGSNVTVRHVPGVDGRRLDPAELRARGVYRPTPGNEMKRGQIGCFLAHRRAWRALISSSCPYAFILEDDANLRPDRGILDQINATVSELGGSFDILYIGRNPILARVRKRISPGLIIPGKTWGLYAYIISRHAAQRLLDLSATMREAVDIFVSETAHGLRMFALDPSVVGTVPVVSDTYGIA